jgi:hypothetical protein
MRVPDLNWPADLYKDADIPTIVATDESATSSAMIDVYRIEIERLAPSVSRRSAWEVTTDNFTRAAA